MRDDHFTIRGLLILTIGTLVPIVATAQSPDSLPQHRSRSAHVDSAGYDLAMGAHYGEPARWSVALGVERYRQHEFRQSQFLLVEPGTQAHRISFGIGSETGADLATAFAMNVRASYLRIRTPRPHASKGNYGGIEGQLLFLGIGARLGAFSSAIRRRPIATIDASLNF